MDREKLEMQIDVILKRFEQPDETRTMTLGKFEIVHLGGVTIGQTKYGTK